MLENTSKKKASSKKALLGYVLGAVVALTGVGAAIPGGQAVVTGVLVEAACIFGFPCDEETPEKPKGTPGENGAYGQ